MKKFILVFLLVLSLLFVFGCSSDDEPVVDDDLPGEVDDSNGVEIIFDPDDELVDEENDLHDDELDDFLDEEFFDYIESVNTEYSDGVLFYDIEVLKPTPCHDIEIVEELRDDVLVITLSFVSTEEMCAQVITPETVSGEFGVDFEPNVLVFSE